MKEEAGLHTFNQSRYGKRHSSSTDADVRISASSWIQKNATPLVVTDMVLTIPRLSNSVI